jgi:glycosyltransferase involved in cell wall biosynthesis
MAISGYQQLFSPNVKLTVVGAVDEQTRRYSTELEEMTVDLGIEANVEWLSHVTDSKIDDLLCNSNVYVNASEHEGFCVPIIEAQAVGLPVISVDCAASRETLGPNQAVIPLPVSDADYDLLAGLIHEVAKNQTFRRGLVQRGFENVYKRFSDDPIENTLVESICRVTGKPG